jgi:hypothetical protein
MEVLVRKGCRLKECESMKLTEHILVPPRLHFRGYHISRQQCPSISVPLDISALDISSIFDFMSSSQHNRPHESRPDLPILSPVKSILLTPFLSSQCLTIPSGCQYAIQNSFSNQASNRFADTQADVTSLHRSLKTRQVLKQFRTV